ncbi:MAG: DNA-3-methyladenine glycosylase [Planctomycetes bacterium]|nr:DNA-3-methyladenine glycosylase [Planctomycetota bacterium]
MKVLDQGFYRRSAEVVAKDLLGKSIVRKIGRKILIAKIVETEAYPGAHDAACHAFEGRRTRRNESMFLDGGHAYVFMIYGFYFCLNAVTGARDDGQAVLIRAAEPLEGETIMRVNRGLAPKVRPGDVAGGPGKLCKALAIDKTLDGVSLRQGSLVIADGEKVASKDIAIAPRVGVDYAGDAAYLPLRFCVRGNPHVSKPRPA